MVAVLLSRMQITTAYDKSTSWILELVLQLSLGFESNLLVTSPLFILFPIVCTAIPMKEFLLKSPPLSPLVFYFLIQYKFDEKNTTNKALHHTGWVSLGVLIHQDMAYWVVSRH